MNHATGTFSEKYMSRDGNSRLSFVLFVHTQYLANHILGEGESSAKGPNLSKIEFHFFHFMRKAFWRRTTEVEPGAQDTQKAIEIKRMNKEKQGYP